MGGWIKIPIRELSEGTTTRHITTSSAGFGKPQVFGKPVTQGTRIQRALKAKKNMNAGGKLEEVMRVINQMQKVATETAHRYTVSTTILKVYNATGDVMTHMGGYHWEGDISGYKPTDLLNGQWGVFEHYGTSGQNRTGSVAAVVYSIEDCGQAIIAWNNPWKKAQGGNNTAYSEMDNVDFLAHSDWEGIHESLLGSGKRHQSSMDCYVTKVSIDAGGNAPFYSAISYLNV